MISFGDKFEFLHKKSCKNTEKNVERSLEKIKKFTADMGGTELYDAIKSMMMSV